MNLDRSDKIGSIVIRGFIGGILAAILKSGSVRDPLTESVGVLLGAIIIGPIIMKFIEINKNS